MQNLSLNSIHEEIWNLLKNAIDDISSAFHFPNLATISLDMNPTSRTVVLRNDALDLCKVNFRRIDIHIEWIDWLYLLHTGHRRAKFSYETEIKMNWLAP